MPSPDHYATLGVPRDASATEIRDAYEAQLRQHGVGRDPADPKAAAVERRIKEAYEVLADPDRRRHYDLQLVQESFRAEDFVPAGAEPEAARPTSQAIEPGMLPISEVPVEPVDLSAYSTLTTWLPAVLLGVVLIALVVSMWLPPRARQEPVDSLANRHSTTISTTIRELCGALAELSSILDEGARTWRRMCLEGSAGAGTIADAAVWSAYQRRYQDSSRLVTQRIGTAERDGVFTLPLVPRDQDILRAVLSLRGRLAEEGDRIPLDCRNDLPLRRLTVLAAQATAGERCLNQILRAGIENLSDRSRAGYTVCASARGSAP